MKIYFGFTVAGDRSTVDVARRIVTLLEKDGHEVLTRHLVDDNAGASDRALGPGPIYTRDMDWLAQSDIFIAEVSGSSFGLGFEAGYTLGATMKRAVLFYRVDAAPRLSLMILGNSHPRCTLVPYASATEIETTLRDIISSI
jgi:hypothetical protein